MVRDPRLPPTAAAAQAPQHHISVYFYWFIARRILLVHCKCKPSSVLLSATGKMLKNKW